MSDLNLPIDTLVSRANEQRKRIHNDIAGLRSSLQEARSSLRQAMEPKKLARENLRSALGVAAIVGLVAGYGFAGMFARD